MTRMMFPLALGQGLTSSRNNRDGIGDLDHLAARCAPAKRDQDALLRTIDAFLAAKKAS